MEKIWKPVINYEGIYEVSNYGDIKSVDRIVNSKTKRFCKGTIIKQNKDEDGYNSIHLYKNGKRRVFFVHRLVISSFIGIDKNKTQVNHKNGNKSDNNINNLEWMTPLENTRHAWQTGLAGRLGGF